MMSARSNIHSEISHAVTEVPMVSKKMKAIIFINVYCIFDMIDNINAKTAMIRDVDVLDLALSRIAFNFISACFFIGLSG